MNVLFCTDGSPASYNAVSNFLNWFKEVNIDIFCAADWSFLPDSIVVEDSDFPIKCSNSANAILDYSYEYLTDKGITPGKKIKICGAVVDGILEICADNNYDIIVLGSNGKKGIQKWLGSVSQEIATASAVSTYISKKDNYAKKVLFAVNDVDLVINGLSEFISRMNLKDKIIYLTTVYETPDYLFLEGNLNKSWLEDVNKKQEFHASAILGKYEKIFNDSGLCINTRKILNGNPSAELIKYASEENVDLIVCLEREKSGLSKIILPSVSRRILENSLSDVILIKPDSH